MMRVLLIILAFYTATLSCIPCKDSVSTDSNVSMVTLINSDEGQSPDIDLCTPFCTCSCCAGISLQQQVASLPSIGSFSTFEDITFAYLSRSHSNDLTSIWQPPRA